MKPEDLYNEGPAAGSKAPILITHFEGAMDAGSAGTLAVVQLLHSLSTQRVATFNTDQLLDYRSHRPVMEVDEWVTTEVVSPEIALDLIHDDAGTPILVLHGPEPDWQWNMFRDAVAKLAEDAGVEVVFSFHGLPAAVPHTRPATVHLQSTDRDLIPSQPLMGGQARFPAPLTAFLQYHLRKGGATGVTLLSTVPYYMADMTFPRASSALLRRLAEMADLQLPVGDLERGADEDAGQVERLLTINPDLQRTVSALEAHFDSIAVAAAEGVKIDGRGELQNETAEDLEETEARTDWAALMDLAMADEGDFPEAELLEDTPSDSMADVIGDAIESYLKTRSKQKRTSEHVRAEGRPDSAQSEQKEAEVAKRPAPRHRAPSPWEIARKGPDGDGGSDGGATSSEDDSSVDEDEDDDEG